MQNLFENSKLTPLAERCRPVSLDDYFGQDEITAQGRVVSEMLKKKVPFSMVLWGEPGCGKTTLARIIAKELELESHFLSAVSCGVADVREVIAEGKKNRERGEKTLLFLDEIHRFNKAQQDSILSAVENGDIILIGATTENPSFSVIRPLLSRSRVLKLKKLSNAALTRIIDRALSTDPLLSQAGAAIEDTARDLLIEAANGDARRMLNILETAFLISGKNLLTDQLINEAIKETYTSYDRAGDRHYDTISAFIKSVRGSDPDAAILYLAMMIHAGEDPMFLARRMVISAAEDIGNASPTALTIALSALHAVEKIGMPEARIVLAQCAVFLASSPKSNASYLAIDQALDFVSKNSVEIPIHLRNAPTELMSKLGYGKEYKYPHNYPGSFIKEKYLPENAQNLSFYRPSENGTEKQIKDRLMTLWPERFNKGDSHD